ncbi:MAG: hypothetical protein FWD38_10350 [Oscillospiraceae bacterium]|nr:hypothetical protein [Oscillospiraceae bacterium]
MDSNKARLLLKKLGAKRDMDMLSNDNEYYYREEYPVFWFSIPKEGNLSRWKGIKLLEISEKLINYKRGDN